MGISARAERGSTDDDGGFGLVEVIIAIVILGLLAVAILPMIITGLQISAQRGSVATATQLVSRTIDEARADTSGGCAGLAISDSSEVDGRSTDLLITGLVVPNSVSVADVVSGAYDPSDPANDVCDGFEGPGTVKYIVVVGVDGGDPELASATTLIFLPETEA